MSNVDNNANLNARSTVNKTLCERKTQPLSFGLTNARSLTDKIEAMADYFPELDLVFTIVTETWFYAGAAYEATVETLRGGHGLEVISKMRKKTGSSNPGGGVSIVYKKDKIRLKEHKIYRANYEIVAATGKIPNNSRQFYIIGIYLSPRLKAKTCHKIWPVCQIRYSK